MTRSERLNPVRRVTEAREQDAARELGECQQQLQRLQQQLLELEGYRREYQAHYQQSGQAGITAQRLLQLQQFLANIDKAVAQQQQEILAAERRCEERRQRWFAARGRSQALDKVAERYQEDERQQQGRREQKESDEFALRGGPGRKK